jgi:solute carrier family 25 (mitochondrial carnitine/acylcarnitine transporter), member 20/29
MHLGHLSCAQSCFQVRRQLEYTIAAKKGVQISKPPGTVSAVRDIVKNSGFLGLYTGFRLHFGRLR